MCAMGLLVRLFSDRVVKQECVKHSALTKFIKRKWASKATSLQSILSECQVSKCLGSLPKELRENLPADTDITQATIKFHTMLVTFIRYYGKAILDGKLDGYYVFYETIDMYGSECVFESKKRNERGFSQWQGSIGVVVKVSLPQINVSYALKIFFDWANIFAGHGPWNEIATAFAANKAESRNNCPVYMASLGNVKYMLSQWGGDFCGSVAVKQNKYKIFETEETERRLSNYRKGRLIDWGGTRPTDYGLEKYPVRKIYRTMLYAAEHGDENLMRMVCLANTKNICLRQNLDRAVDLLFVDLFCEESPLVQCALDMSQQYVR